MITYIVSIDSNGECRVRSIRDFRPFSKDFVNLMKISKLSFHFQVIITFRIGWRRSYSYRTFCTQSTISSGHLIGINGYLKCRDRCYGNVGSLVFKCTDFSTNEDWTIGTNSFQYTFPIPSISPRYYQVRLVSNDLYKLWLKQKVAFMTFMAEMMHRCIPLRNKQLRRIPLKVRALPAKIIY